MNKPDRGVALLITLWVLLLLTVLAMNLLFSIRHGSASTRNFKEETMAYYSALSAYEEVTGYLMSDKDMSTDFFDSDGIFLVDSERPPVSGKKTYDNFTVEIKLSDEESRLNINTLNEPLLTSLFTKIGIPEDSVSGLIDSVLDWRDPDDLHRLSGAESDYYEALDPAYQAKNKPFDIPEEFLLIKGVKPEYLYGGEDISPLYPLITTYGLSVNINTASADVLGLIGINPVDIENIMALRTREAGGMRVVPAIGTGIPLSTTSDTFRIEVTAQQADSALTIKITSIVRRTSGLKGLELKTLYWKEGIESSRT